MSGLEIKAELAACFVVCEDESIYRLLLLSRLPTDLQTPGAAQILYGHIEEGESAEETVIREIGEETGLKTERLFSLNETFIFYDRVSRSMQVTPVFVAFVDKRQPVAIDGREHYAAEWISFDEARDRLFWPAQTKAFEILSTLLAGKGLPEAMRITIPESKDC